MIDMAFWPARRLASALRRRKVGAAELLAHYLDRLGRYNPALGAVVVWIIATAIWRYVSLASCIAAVAIPSLVVAEFAALGRMDSAVPFLAATGAIALLVIARHRPNLARLIRGQERKIGQRDDPG